MRRDSVLGKIDWWTLGLYVALAIMGWLAICGASYDYIETNFLDFFSLSERTGKQAMWMVISAFVGIILLFFDKRMYKDWAFIIYVLTLLLCVVTIFVSPDIKGSHSWIVIGPFSLQPAEFMKFATALALASFMTRYGFNINENGNIYKCIAIIAIPILIIIGQRETGSALVYLAFFLVLYREGMTGLVLLSAISLILYFVVGIRFSETALASLPTNLGHYLVLLLIHAFSICMTKFWCKNGRTAFILLAVNIVVSLVSYWIAVYLITFNIIYVQYMLVVFNIVYLMLNIRLRREKRNLWVILFILGSLVFYNSCDYVMHSVLRPHQRIRIEVLLGLKDDIANAGYNVHQSKIAIGSGGVFGKGFLNGTQTKLKYVPEQDTDFIFCTIGEEQGFVGSTFVLVVFVSFILRLMSLAERQNDTFGRVYGYSLVSIFFFHFTINVGMVLGIMPVIGIPLPFFSYGGSSFLGFSILLFSFLRIDADRDVRA